MSAGPAAAGGGGGGGDVIEWPRVRHGDVASEFISSGVSTIKVSRFFIFNPTEIFELKCVSFQAD